MQLAPTSRREVEEIVFLPEDRAFTSEFRRLFDLALDWLLTYYDGSHLARAAYWACRLDPDVAEPVVIAALLHDIERAVPGGLVLDKRATRWDDPEYNRAHCARSAEIVVDWLRRNDAAEEFVAGVQLPILEHEFGGSLEGNLVQAADSLSFLEIYLPRALGWIEAGECDLVKAEEKVDFMFFRIRMAKAKEIARPYYERFRYELRYNAISERKEAFR